MRKLLLSLLLVVILLFSTATALAADSATLSIVPEQAKVVADGGETHITYTITVTPPQGKEIGVFSFRLKPSGDMTLPDSFQVDGERVIAYESPELEYDQNEGTGVFNTYEYTPSGSFFAAVGSREGQRMTEAAAVLTITATVPAGSTGAYLLDAEFVAAPDGSGQTYAGKVAATPVLITDANSGDTPGGTVIVSDLDTPIPGEKPDTDVTLVTEKEDSTAYSTTWYRDGEKMAGKTFEPGHVYTAVIHVRTDGAFGTEICTNEGYTLNRISDTELELRRSFYVAETYTQELTEEEAAQTFDAAAAQTDIQMEEPAQTSAWLLPTLFCVAVAIAAALLLLLRKKRSTDTV